MGYVALNENDVLAVCAEFLCRLQRNPLLCAHFIRMGFYDSDNLFLGVCVQNIGVYCVALSDMISCCVQNFDVDYVALSAFIFYCVCRILVWIMWRSVK